MTQKKNDVVGIAKGSTTKKSTTRRKTAPKKPTTAQVKAKEAVGDLLEFDEGTPVTDNPKNVKWLEEQVQLLSTENEELKQKLAQPAPPQVNQAEQGVVRLFSEVQAEYLKYPPSARRQISLIALLDKMIVNFPFLKAHVKKR